MENKTKLSVDKSIDPELTGEVIFGWDDDGPIHCDIMNFIQIGFYCGPEKEGGYLSDQHDVDKIYRKLRKVFNQNGIKTSDDEDMDENAVTDFWVEIGSSENTHTVYVRDLTINIKDLQSRIEKILLAAGAKQGRF